MTSRRRLRLAVAGLAALCTSASVAAGPSAPVAPPREAGSATYLLRSSVRVAPVQVLLQTAPPASTTVAALPQVPRTLDSRGIPGRALVAYRAAAEAVAPASCRLPWELLAGIGLIESGHGSVHDGAIGADGRVSPPILGPRLDGSGAYALIRDSDGGRLDGDPSLDRAVGPMQFIPSTWARHGADGDGNGSADPHDLDDAALSAARYLCHTSGRLDRPSGAIAAVFSYNHSYDYVRVVLTAAARYAGQSPQSWGVGLLPVAAEVVEGSPGPTVAQPSPQPEATFATAATAEPTPQGSATLEPEPDPEGAPSPESEPLPQGEPSQEPSPEPSPAEEPSPTPGSAG